MWREEAGIMEMLMTYMSEFESFSGWSSWRSVLMDILSCHEAARQQRMESSVRQEGVMEEEVKCKKEGEYGERSASWMKGCGVIEELKKEEEEISVCETFQLVTTESYEERHGRGNEKSTLSEVASWYEAAFLPCVEGGSLENDGGRGLNTTRMPQKCTSVLDTGTCDDTSDIVEVNDASEPRFSPSFSRESSRLVVGEDLSSVGGSDLVLRTGVSVITDQGMVDDSMTDNTMSGISQENQNNMMKTTVGESSLGEQCVKPNDAGMHSVTHRFSCSYCPKTFSYRSGKMNHECIHTKIRAFSCRYCAKTFARKNRVTLHERIHTGEKPYACRFCPKKFAEITNRNCHERIHTGEKPYSCSFCPKTFSQSSEKKGHERMHKGEKPYCCRFCSRAFTHSCHKLAHERVHTGEKPYPCKYCPKSFTRSTSKVRHEQRVHEGDQD